MVLRSSEQLSEELGETILDQYQWCSTVYQHTTTTGQSRIPKLVLLAGRDDPEVIHRENGVSYKLDLRRITFSGGNRRLRERLADQVNDGEFLLDMFAAIGNLSMQPLVHSEIEALLVERNPYTFSYLQQTLELNNLDTKLAMNTDCRSITMVDQADRILLGYHEVNKSHVATAVNAAADGAMLHFHPIVRVDKWQQTIDQYVSMLVDLDTIVMNVTTNQVKGYAPNLEHIEIIIQINK